MTNPILPLAKHFLIERPAGSQSYSQLATRLESDTSKLVDRFTTVADTPDNRRTVRHIIGLERWGQRRLRVALGEPVVHDEMDSYEPPAETPLAELRTIFAATRRTTVTLARELEAHGVDGKLLINHNQFGPVTARGWLLYLNTHASLEAKRLK